MKGNSQMSRMQGKTFSKPSHQGQVFVGIDVSKRHLDVHIHPDDIWHRVTNDKVGHELLARHLKQRSVRLVVMEATGRYHRLVHRHLSDAGFHVAVMNPYRTRKFADMLGKFAKTDKIDAKTLALFAEMVRPDATTPPVPSMAILTEQLVARRQINEERVALQSQLNETTVPTIARQIRARIKMCQRHQLALEKDIRGAIQQSDVLQRRFDILTSIPGIALITAATLIAELGELGNINAAKVAALVGVAPMNCDSGVWRGKRKIRGGRKMVRNVLYMAAVTSIRANPDMAQFYKRLKNNGKPFKVAITAVIRKLAILANTLISENREWTQSSQFGRNDSGSQHQRGSRLVGVTVIT